MIVAVDTGGTKTLVAVFDTDGQVVAEEKFPTPTDIDTYVATLNEFVTRMTSGESMTCLSLALPGEVSGGFLVTAGNLGWQNQDMQAKLSTLYDCPIVIENDANLAGLAEARALDPTPERVLYVTVSTGIGTGIITSGQIDPHYATSEGGHMVLAHGDGFARWETFASGKAIHKKYDKLASEIEDPRVWDEIALNIARGIMVITPLLRPQAVVIGGGVGTHFDKFSARLLAVMSEHLPAGYIPAISEAVHPEEAVIYGCYYHAIDVLAA